MCPGTERNRNNDSSVNHHFRSYAKSKNIINNSMTDKLLTTNPSFFRETHTTRITRFYVTIEDTDGGNAGTESNG